MVNISCVISYKYDVFGELYEKYNSPGANMPPELKLVLMLTGSAVKFHLANTIFTKLHTLDSELQNNPNLVNILRQQACTKKQPFKENLETENKSVLKKMTDLSFLKEKELEFLRSQKEQMSVETEISDKQVSLQPPKINSDLLNKLNQKIETESKASSSTSKTSKSSTISVGRKKKPNIIQL